LLAFLNDALGIRKMDFQVDGLGEFWPEEE
jgi:hypothetical protein